MRTFPGGGRLEGTGGGCNDLVWGGEGVGALGEGVCVGWGGCVCRLDGVCGVGRT